MDDARVVIYDCSMFIIQATGFHIWVKHLALLTNIRLGDFEKHSSLFYSCKRFYSRSRQTKLSYTQLIFTYTNIRKDLFTE